MPMPRICCCPIMIRATRRFLTGRALERGILLRQGRHRAGDRSRLGLRPYADLIWCETSKPDMAEARRFAAAIHAKFPGKLLAYNCSPSFNWQAKLDAAAMKKLARGAGRTRLSLPVHHAGGLACAESVDVRTGFGLQRRRHARLFAAAAARIRPGGRGYRATKHQAFVGTGYFDAVQTAISAGAAFDRGDGRQHRDRAVHDARSRAPSASSRSALRPMSAAVTPGATKTASRRRITPR